MEVTVLPSSHIPYPLINGALHPLFCRKSVIIFSSCGVTASPPVIGYFISFRSIFFHFFDCASAIHILVGFSVIVGLYFFIPSIILSFSNCSSGITVIPMRSGIKISSTFPVENQIGITA